ncbi:hypothetical protein F1C16_00240 [Hymenobacter sp. NBH84]|nr:hypothetical protein F1C16_00240 [Hymenobacter sp. NBH84]
MKHYSLLLPRRVGRLLGLAVLLLSGSFWVAPSAAVAQTAQEPFGRVRLQYKRFDWMQLSTQNFNVYYYAGGEIAARRAAEYAEKELQRITSLIGYYPYSKTTIMLYNSVGDLRQSNIGLDQDKYQMGGETSLLRMTKVQIAYQGQQTQFKRDVSYQVTRVLLNDMMYGGSLKEVLQSTYLLQLPDWFIGGASAYAAEGWSVDMDNYMRDMTQQYEGTRTAPFFLRNPQLAGQSIWNYIAERYGYTTIQNILNLTRITRDVEVGISSSLNVPYKIFLRDWLQYYRQLNAQPQTAFVPLNEKAQLTSRNNRKSVIYSQPVLSPNGQRLAYVANEGGRYRVIVVNRDGSHRDVIHRNGYRTPDQQVETRLPVLAWRGNNQVAVAEMDKGYMTLRLRQAGGSGFANTLERLLDALPFRRKDESIFRQFTQVMSLAYSPDGKSLVFSAARDGQNDLYLLRAGSRRPEKLTDDVFDDVEPTFLPNGEGIVFSSNRWLDSTGTARGDFSSVVNNYDLFLYHLDGRPRPMESLVSTISNEGTPRAISDSEIMYLGEESGIRSVYRLNLATRQRAAVTSFPVDIRSFDYNATTNALGFVTTDRARDAVFLYPNYPLPEGVKLYRTARQETLEDRSRPKPAPVRRPATPAAVRRPAPAPTATDSTLAVTTPAATPDTSQTTAPVVATPSSTAPRRTQQVNVSDYKFDEDIPMSTARNNTAQRRRTPSATTKALTAAPTPPPANALAINGPYRYDNRFSIDNVVSSLYVDPLLGFGLIGQANMSDLFENHRIRASIFALTDLKTSNMYAEYTNLTHRYDWSIRYQKQAYFLNVPDLSNYLTRYGRHEIAPTIAYPLTHNLSVRGGPSYVNVSRLVLNDLPGEADVNRNYLGFNGELIFDNAIATGVNMLQGTRMKIGYQKMTSMDNNDLNLSNLYVDLRHYQKIHRSIIWATRVSHGQFFGPAQSVYRLGGMDNWLNNKFENDPALPQTQRLQPSTVASSNYDPTQLFYQQFVTNLRGFNYSKRNGPKYILFNTELRVPIIQYLSNKPIYSGFFRNLQLTGFVDGGSAYSGVNPFNTNNSYNTQPFGGNGNAFSGTVTTFGNPLLIGYGGGIRTTILGFYGKADVAWGQEDYNRSGPKFYFTLGYDF